MRKHSAGGDGRGSSINRGKALSALGRVLERVQFPITKQALLEEAGDVEVEMGVKGGAVELGDIIRNLEVDEFSSSRHVREVVSINWQDFADIFPPEGSG